MGGRGSRSRAAGGGGGEAAAAPAAKVDGTALSTKEFSDQVQATVDKMPADAGYGEKVFIDDAYRAVSEKMEITREQFNRRLIQGRQAGHLNLSRADTIPPSKVAQANASAMSNLTGRPVAVGESAGLTVNFIDRTSNR